MKGRKSEMTPSPGGRDGSGGPPAALSAVPEEALVLVDVRDDLRAGREPFGRIMEARGRVPEGGALVVRAIFEPAPLYRVMAGQGFRHWTERLAADDWRVWFYPDSPGRGEESRSATGATSAETVEPDPKVRVLDVRGLEPPEPLVRTLEALEELPAGASLVQINVREPRFLFPHLEERGFTWDVSTPGDGLVRVLIRRRPGA